MCYRERNEEPRAEDAIRLEVIDAAEVRERLSMSECIDLMAHAMTAVTRGTISIPSRTVMPFIDNSGYRGLMRGSVSDPAIYGAEIVSLHPVNAREGHVMPWNVSIHLSSTSNSSVYCNPLQAPKRWCQYRLSWSSCLPT